MRPKQLSNAQVLALETLLAQTIFIEGYARNTLKANVYMGLQSSNVLDHVGRITPYGIQCLCYTGLTAYTGSTHTTVHCYLNDWQRLFG